MAYAYAVTPRASHYRQPGTCLPIKQHYQKWKSGRARRRQTVQHADAGRARGAGHEEAVGVLAQVGLCQPELAAAAARAHPAAGAGRRGSRRTRSCARPVLMTALGCSGLAGGAGPPLHVVQVHLQKYAVTETGPSNRRVHCSRARVSPCQPMAPSRALLSIFNCQFLAMGWYEGRPRMPTCSATASSACSACSATCRSYAARPRSLRSTCTP